MLTSLRFWGAERGSDKFGPNSHAMQDSVALRQPILPDNCTFASPASSPARPKKRQRDSAHDSSPYYGVSDRSPPAKRAKVDAPVQPVAPVAIASPPDTDTDISMNSPPAASDKVEKACDAIHYQFGLEILLKHDELRLINQELAKCQVALEQLRRCHLIPYPVSRPTPEQMMEVSSGKGPAVQNRVGEVVPQWAPPFGVVDGPYARHYAKWLIPDPKFDGLQPEWQPATETGRGRASAEGRTTRNSVDIGAVTKPRRGMPSQKLQSLSSGYAQPKDKAGPCVLKRSDGQTVKLVCLDCQRENFSSTQGFINHCRIAHRRDFKSHEEAAMHSGHPIVVNESCPAVPEEKAKEKEIEKAPSSAVPKPTGLVHPFANAQLTDQQAYTTLQSRITASLELYHQGKLPGVTSIPTVSKSDATKATHTNTGFVSDSSTPFLSKLMQKREFQGNLSEIVSDAKQKISLDMFTPGDESEDLESASGSLDSSSAALPASRGPVVMRVPARVAMSPALHAPSTRPTSSKGMSPNMGFASPPLSLSDKDEPRFPLLQDEDVDMDADLSPNTLVSNNAPSLVSDDGEYDDSDDGSSVTDANDALETESVSDVAEITIDEDQETRPLRHHRTSSAVGSGMRLKKDEAKHVTFINPAKKNTKRARRV